MNTQLLFGVAVVPAIIGLTQLAKETGIPSRFAPVIAVVFGVLAALAQVYAGQWPWIPAIVLGVSLGLSAVGLYSTTVTLTTPGTPPQARVSDTVTTAPAGAGLRAGPPPVPVAGDGPAPAVPVTIAAATPAPDPLVSSSGVPLH